ncbi:hypothetical protein BV22DRAFT_314848 [Leucogyrophana mollusca]|uniref:Uncharacterized protein n=1 Tax=Leucogyrophana mollusca TaxID=85980 RepID=A0ACB8BN95_9AGAM|nr:hypothetical protein BV22DRAFT_314848 [Leucogyrophana mollusca]
MSIELTKRTRSQLTIPDNILQLPLARSPLKDARFAARSYSQLQVPESSEPKAMDESEDDILLSPNKNKRTSSATRPDDGPISPSTERNPKRAKIDPLPSLKLYSKDEGSLTIPDASPTTKRRSKRRAATAPASRKPHSSSAAVNAAPSFTFAQRAQSVPLSTEPVRHIDLQTILSSPTRSPTKNIVNGGLHITPLPSMGEVPPPSDDKVDAEMDVDTSSSSISMSYFTNTPLAPPPANPVPDFTFEPATPRRSDDPFYPPMSPLTPLPPTPFVSRTLMPLEKGTRKPSPLQFTKEETESDATMESMSSKPTPSTSVAPPSRLPRPATSSSSLMPPPPVPAKRDRAAIVGTNSNHAASGSKITAGTSKDITSSGLSKGKRPVPRSSGPRRVTRSVSMKDKERVKDIRDSGPETDDHKAVPHADPPAPSESTNGEEEEPSVTNPVPVPSSSSSSSSQPGPLLGTYATPALTVQGTITHKSSSQTPSEAPKAKLKQSSLNAFMKPKPSVASSSTPVAIKSKPPPSPSKLPVLAGKSPAKPSLLPTPGKSRPPSSLSKAFSTTDVFSSKPPSSSLSTLANALDKLAMPPPSRPNTSMGFNREVEDEADDESGEQEKVGKDKGKAKDDGAIGKASHGAIGIGTSAMRPPALLQRSATVGASIFSRSGGATGSRAGGIIAKMKSKGGGGILGGQPKDESAERDGEPRERRRHGRRRNSVSRQDRR